MFCIFFNILFACFQNYFPYTKFWSSSCILSNLKIKSLSFFYVLSLTRSHFTCLWLSLNLPSSFLYFQPSFTLFYTPKFSQIQVFLFLPLPQMFSNPKLGLLFHFSLSPCFYFSLFNLLLFFIRWLSLSLSLSHIGFSRILPNPQVMILLLSRSLPLFFSNPLSNSLYLTFTFSLFKMFKNSKSGDFFPLPYSFFLPSSSISRGEFALLFSFSFSNPYLSRYLPLKFLQLSR